jgi:hypothetical protein
LFGSKPDTLNVFRTFDDPHQIYFTNKEPTVQGVIAFLADLSIPVLTEFSERYSSLITERDSLVLFTSDPDYDKDLIDRYRAIAKVLKNKQIIFAISGVENGV